MLKGITNYITFDWKGMTKYITVDNGVRFVNATALGLGVYELCTNPTAKLIEFGPDLGIHFMQAVFPNRFNNFLFIANFARGFQAGFASLTNIALVPGIPWAIPTTFPSPQANGADGLTHAVNAYKRLENVLDEFEASKTKEEDAKENISASSKPILFLAQMTVGNARKLIAKVAPSYAHESMRPKMG